MNESRTNVADVDGSSEDRTICIYNLFIWKFNVCEKCLKGVHVHPSSLKRHQRAGACHRCKLNFIVIKVNLFNINITHVHHSIRRNSEIRYTLVCVCISFYIRDEYISNLQSVGICTEHHLKVKYIWKLNKFLRIGKIYHFLWFVSSIGVLYATLISFQT